MEKTRILVVDDEQEICNITQHFLEKKDYEVSTAMTVSGAVNLVKQVKPHIVLLDIRLGADSGLEVLRQAKEIDKNVKIIMVTALDDEESITKAKALGADDYITKPFTARYLNDFILQKIANLRLRQLKE